MQNSHCRHQRCSGASRRRYQLWLEGHTLVSSGSRHHCLDHWQAGKCQRRLHWITGLRLQEGGVSVIATIKHKRISFVPATSTILVRAFEIILVLCKRGEKRESKIGSGDLSGGQPLLSRLSLLCRQDSAVVRLCLMKVSDEGPYNSSALLTFDSAASLKVKQGRKYSQGWAHCIQPSFSHCHR